MALGQLVNYLESEKSPYINTHMDGIELDYKLQYKIRRNSKYRGKCDFFKVKR